MKFQSAYIHSPSMTVGEVIEREALRYDPYDGGQIEHLQHQARALCSVVCAIIPLLSEEQQEALVAHFAPSYKRVEGS